MGTGECVMNFSLSIREQHSGPEKANCTQALASFPGSPHARTGSDRKLGGAWERGYTGMTGLVTVKQCLATHTLKLVWKRPSNEVF